MFDKTAWSGSIAEHLSGSPLQLLIITSKSATCTCSYVRGALCCPIPYLLGCGRFFLALQIVICLSVWRTVRHLLRASSEFQFPVWSLNSFFFLLKKKKKGSKVQRTNKAADPVQKKQGTSRILNISGSLNKRWETLTSVYASVYTLENEK